MATTSSCCCLHPATTAVEGLHRKQFVHQVDNPRRVAAQLRHHRELRMRRHRRSNSCCVCLASMRLCKPLVDASDAYRRKCWARLHRLLVQCHKPQCCLGRCFGRCFGRRRAPHPVHRAAVACQAAKLCMPPLPLELLAHGPQLVCRHKHVAAGAALAIAAAAVAAGFSASATAHLPATELLPPAHRRVRVPEGQPLQEAHIGSSDGCRRCWGCVAVGILCARRAARLHLTGA